MKIATHFNPTNLLILVSVFIFSALLLTTFVLSTKQTEQKNNSSQPSSNNPMLEDLTRTPIPTSSEEAPAPTDSTESSSVDKASTSQQSTSNSQTTINISNGSSNQGNTSVHLKISDDGCTVEAGGPSGTKLTIDAKNNAKGGHQELTLDGTTITVSSGGRLAGMTIAAQLTDPSGAIKASSSSTIGSAGC